VQLSIDSTEPLDKVLAVVGALYGVELIAAGPVASAAAPNVGTNADTAQAAATGKALRKRQPAARRSRRAQAAKPDPVAVRAWARTNGHDVRDRGRVPAAVLTAYTAAGSPAA
jgi:Lsr2